MHDLPFALRTLRRSPRFACVAVLTLALGISANTALHSVFHAVLLRSRGYADPSRLTQIGGTNQQGQSTGVSIPDLLAFQSRAHSFEKIGTFRVQTFTLLGPHEPENVYGHMVSAEFFPALGAAPLLGRPFGDHDFQPSAPPVAILAHSLWKSAFDSDPQIIGRRVLLNGSESAVIGVMRPDFEFPLPPFRIWIPWKFSAADLANHALHTYTLIGRLRAGVSREAAQTELQGLSQSLAAEFPDTNTGWRAAAQPINEQFYGGLRTVLSTLLGAVGLVLLIGCMNVMNLLMARGAERSREMAVRAALGASRRRLMRQLLTESVLIAGLGGALGVLFAGAWLRLLVWLLPARTFSILPGAEAAALDFRMLSISAAGAVTAGLLFGMFPALRLSGTNLEEGLKEGARSNTGGLGRRRFYTGLVILETALSVVLLAGAGLLIRSFRHQVSVPLGFQPEQVLTVQIPSEWTGLTQPNDPASVARRKQYFQNTLSRLQSIPGTTAAAITTVLPLGSVQINTRIFIRGRSETSGADAIRIAYRAVSPDYFRAMGIPIIRGRAFREADREDAPGVAIISEATARRYWPDEDPLGKQLTLNNPRTGPWLTVTGIVGGVRWDKLTAEPGPELYTCFQQVLLAPQVSTIVVRTTRDPLQIAGEVRAAVRQVNPNQPMAEIRTLSRVVSDSVAQAGLYTVLLGCFAALALLLAGAGIFSVIAWTVSQNTHEIGIRMALGAAPRDILRAATGGALLAAAAGAVVGLGGAALLTRLLASQLYGVTPTDPLTFAVTPVLLLAVAGFAAFIPARRALRVDPMVALRSE